MIIHLNSNHLAQMARSILTIRYLRMNGVKSSELASQGRGRRRTVAPTLTPLQVPRSAAVVRNNATRTRVVQSAGKAREPATARRRPVSSTTLGPGGQQELLKQEPLPAVLAANANTRSKQRCTAHEPILSMTLPNGSFGTSSSPPSTGHTLSNADLVNGTLSRISSCNTPSAAAAAMSPRLAAEQARLAKAEATAKYWGRGVWAACAGRSLLAKTISGFRRISRLIKR